MYRSLPFLIFFSFLGLKAERVLSREKSFIAPSQIIREEVKKEKTTPTIVNLKSKIPSLSPRVISLYRFQDTKIITNKQVSTKYIYLRPQDLLYINSPEYYYSLNSFYSIDGSPFQHAIGPIPLPKQGTTVLRYYTLDIFGNRNDNKEKIIAIDLIPPTLKSYWLGEEKGNIKTDICTTNSKLMLEGSDSQSGLKFIYWKYSNEEIWKKYTTPIKLNHSTNANSLVIESYAVDNAGNPSSIFEITCNKNSIEN
ncbi:MAG: hypothetical protein SH817_05960 [Leptospira sp.]|nr:hypothetical protein [Leptospira sp.]